MRRRRRRRAGRRSRPAPRAAPAPLPIPTTLPIRRVLPIRGALPAAMALLGLLPAGAVGQGGATGEPEPGRVEEVRSLEAEARLHLENGSPPAAAQALAGILATGPSGVERVADALDGAGDAGRPALDALWELLETDDATGARAGGVLLALRLGKPERAWRLAEVGAAGASDAERPARLRAFVLEAERAGYPGAAARGALRLAREVGPGPDRRRWLVLSGDLALRNGDPRMARTALEEALAGLEPGTRAHREVLADLFEATATVPEGADRAAELYGTFVRTYPEERAARASMAPSLARARLRAGDVTGADRVLEEAVAASLGPASSGGGDSSGDGTPAERGGGRTGIDEAEVAALERARGRLAFYRGRPAEARARLEAAVGTPGDAPEERTGAIALLGALAAADSAEAALVGMALAGALRGGPEGGAEALLERLARNPPGAGRPALLAIAAAEYDRAGRPDDASIVRRRLAERYPGSPETPGALLELGRRATAGGDAEGARAWLERLILEHPESAVAPLARRLLAELEGRVPGS